jgi:hypothetical protein
MIKSKSCKTSFILCLPVFFLLIGCAVMPYPDKFIQLNRERYVCNVDSAPYKKLHGKRILLASITDNSNNTTNLAYYNPKRTIGYDLYYSTRSMQQPVVSYFWYSLKKAFECTGVRIEESGPIYDAELTLTFNSLTDEKIIFSAVLTKIGKLLYEKEYIVVMPKVQKEEDSILEQRAYSMLDSIVRAILSDPYFQKAFDD